MKALFLLRSYNDIDHMTPVIWKWMKAGHSAFVAPGKHGKDYRVKFLIKHGAKIVPRDFESMNKLIRSSKIKLMAHDWLHDRQPNAGKMAKWARALRKDGVKCVLLPHGDSPYVNRMLHKWELSYKEHHKTSKSFNYVVIPNDLSMWRYEKIMGRNQIKILGSPRYNDEWMAIINKMLPAYKLPTKKLKTVVFLRNKMWPLHWEEIWRGIKMMALLGLSVIVKEHTRWMKKGLPNPIQKFGVKLISTEAHSTSLLKWSDFAVDVGTSMAFECVKTNKPVLSLEYASPNYSTVGCLVEECRLMCRDDLSDAVTGFQKNGTDGFYDEVHRKAFITRVIGDGDVLGRYVQFLEGVCQE